MFSVGTLFVLHTDSTPVLSCLAGLAQCFAFALSLISLARLLPYLFTGHGRWRRHIDDWAVRRRLLLGVPRVRQGPRHLEAQR